jgi:hypothetical protein
VSLIVVLARLVPTTAIGGTTVIIAVAPGAIRGGTWVTRTGLAPGTEALSITRSAVPALVTSSCVGVPLGLPHCVFNASVAAT